MHHELKILPVYFQAHIDGDKPFEIRDNSDRGFQKGDTVTLIECGHGSMTMATGRKVTREITYVTNYCQKHGMVVIGLKDPACSTEIIRGGWQLVPVELTAEMNNAAFQAQNRQIDWCDIEDMYRAMLAAAPKPEGGAA